MHNLWFFNLSLGQRMLLLLLLGVGAGPVLAATTGDTNLDWGMMTIELFGGLALFLFGMMQMEDGLKAVAGERMRNLLAKLTVTVSWACLPVHWSLR